MTTIRFQYDAHNGQFMQRDGQMGSFDDGDTNMVMDFSTRDLDDLSMFAYEDEFPQF